MINTGVLIFSIYSIYHPCYELPGYINSIVTKESSVPCLHPVDNALEPQGLLSQVVTCVVIDMNQPVKRSES